MNFSFPAQVAPDKAPLYKSLCWRAIAAMIETPDQRKAEGLEMFVDDEHLAGVKGTDMATNVEAVLASRLLGIRIDVYHTAVNVEPVPRVFTPRSGVVCEGFAVFLGFRNGLGFFVSSSLLLS